MFLSHLPQSRTDRALFFSRSWFPAVEEWRHVWKHLQLTLFFSFSLSLWLIQSVLTASQNGCAHLVHFCIQSLLTLNLRFWKSISISFVHWGCFEINMFGGFYETVQSAFLLQGFSLMSICHWIGFVFLLFKICSSKNISNSVKKTNVPTHFIRMENHRGKILIYWSVSMFHWLNL